MVYLIHIVPCTWIRRVQFLGTSRVVRCYHGKPATQIRVYILFRMSQTIVLILKGGRDFIVFLFLVYDIFIFSPSPLYTIFRHHGNSQDEKIHGEDRIT